MSNIDRDPSDRGNLPDMSGMLTGSIEAALNGKERETFVFCDSIIMNLIMGRMDAPSRIDGKLPGYPNERIRSCLVTEYAKAMSWKLTFVDQTGRFRLNKLDGSVLTREEKTSSTESSTEAYVPRVNRISDKAVPRQSSSASGTVLSSGQKPTKQVRRSSVPNRPAPVLPVSPPTLKKEEPFRTEPEIQSTISEPDQSERLTPESATSNAEYTSEVHQSLLGVLSSVAEAKEGLAPSAEVTVAEVASTDSVAQEAVTRAESSRADSAQPSVQSSRNEGASMSSESTSIEIASRVLQRFLKKFNGWPSAGVLKTVADFEDGDLRRTISSQYSNYRDICLANSGLFRALENCLDGVSVLPGARAISQRLIKQVILDHIRALDFDGRDERSDHFIRAAEYLQRQASQYMTGDIPTPSDLPDDASFDVDDLEGSVPVAMTDKEEEPDLPAEPPVVNDAEEETNESKQVEAPEGGILLCPSCGGLSLLTKLKVVPMKFYFAGDTAVPEGLIISPCCASLVSLDGLTMTTISVSAP